MSEIATCLVMCQLATMSHCRRASIQENSCRQCIYTPAIASSCPHRHPHTSARSLETPNRHRCPPPRIWWVLVLCHPAWHCSAFLRRKGGEYNTLKGNKPAGCLGFLASRHPAYAAQAASRQGERHDETGY